MFCMLCSSHCCSGVNCSSLWFPDYTRFSLPFCQPSYPKNRWIRLGAHKLSGEIPLSSHYLKVNKNINVSGLSGVPLLFISSVWSHLVLNPMPWSSCGTEQQHGLERQIINAKVRCKQEEATVWAAQEQFPRTYLCIDFFTWMLLLLPSNLMN